MKRWFAGKELVRFEKRGQEEEEKWYEKGERRQNAQRFDKVSKVLTKLSLK